MAYSSAKEALEALIHAYYDARDIEAILSCVTDDVEWIGTETNDIAKGKEAMRTLVEADVAAFPNSLTVKVNEPGAQWLGTEAVVFTVTGEQRDVFGGTAGLSIRGTICCVKTDKGWLIANGHTSVPSSETEKMALQDELNSVREKQQALLENVPGGVAMYRVKKDGRIAADYVSDGLARICGYDDGKDIMRVMKHDARKLVLPEDYPAVATAYRASIERGIATSVNYRVYGKDGNPIRITLDSVVMKNVKLKEDDVAVFYAVQTLVSEEAQKVMEEQKVLRMLMDRVPAGLGIYEMTDGEVNQLYMNDAFYDMIGSSREKRTNFLGKNAISSVHPADEAKIREGLQSMIEGGRDRQIDYRIKNDAGEWIWIHARCSLAECRENYVKVYAAFYECTETKQQQILLQQNQRAVELAQTQGNLSIWTYNIDKHIITQQTPLDVEGHMGYPVNIQNVPQCFVESGSIHPDDIEKYIAAYQKLDEGAKKIDESYRLINRNTGKYAWVHMYYQRMENADDTDRMAVGFSLDVDKQQEALERYHIEEKLREQIYETAILYMEYNLTKNSYAGKKNIWNTSSIQLRQSDTLDDYRRNMREKVEEIYLDAVTEKMYGGSLLKAFERGESKVSCEFRSRERPGKPRTWYRITATMVKNPTTNDVSAFIAVENIEEEIRRRLAIEKSMRDGIEGIAIIHVADKEARIIRSNFAQTPESIGEYFVYDDNFVEASHKMVVPEEQEFSYHAALLSTVEKELETKEIYQYSVSTKSPEGTEKRQLFRFRYIDDRKQDIVMSLSDITTIYMGEQEKKRQLEDALSQAKEANNAKTAFLSRVSHDMRTPLNGILGLTALLRDSITDQEALQDLGELQMSGEYLLNLINDTLDMSRIESGKLELHQEVCVSKAIFNNVINLAKATVNHKKIAINFDFEDLPANYLFVDASRFEQVIMNLVSNAVKFTPEGGTVDLKLVNLSVEEDVITSKMTIRDTGIGMSAEFLPHIFEAFSQENPTRTGMTQGTGLGMAITKQIMELNGGNISVESEQGVGTCFTLILKFRIATEEQVKEWKKTYNRISGGTDLYGKRILLCEDHPLNAKIATRLLEAKEVIVEHAENGQVGVEMFRHSEANYYDAILMDIRMPVKDGIEAAKEIRSLSREDAKKIPIIAMTANAFADDIDQTMKAGMNAHLSKPIQTDLLYHTLMEVLNVKMEMKKQKILVVDDIELNRAIIRTSLERDYEILEAEDGVQALEIIRNTRDLDAIITDIQMPKMNGMELIKAIRKERSYRHVVIIANTQFGDPEQEEKLLELGANDFVYKPTTPKIVAIRIRNALNRL